MRQWEPEQTIEAAIALQLIQEQFPQLCAAKIRFLGKGWDNTVFVVDDKWIFRFPRRAIAVSLLEAEWQLLPKVAPYLPLPIPYPRWKGLSSQAFPWVFVGYEMLPGTSACHANLSEKERSALAEPIARFLAALHRIPFSALADCHIEGDNLGRLNPLQLIPKIRPIFKELAALGFLENEEQLNALIDNAMSLPAPTDSAVVHGDFYVRHLLVDAKHLLVGVIDWGDIHRGDPAIDLAIAHTFLPRKAHEQFRSGYGPISRHTWELARLRAIYSAASLLLYGYHADDASLLREGRRTLAQITAEEGN